MPDVNARNYEVAADLVATGAWRVDAATGEVFGKQNRPFRRRNSAGYVNVRFCDPANPRQYRTVLAHRVVWESAHGPIPAGLTVNHIDGDKTNNALANLELLSLADNTRHAWRMGLVTGHMGAANGNAILTDEDARDIYCRAWSGNESQAVIAADYGVGCDVVSGIKCGRSWRHATRAA